MRSTILCLGPEVAGGSPCHEWLDRFELPHSPLPFSALVREDAMETEEIAVHMKGEQPLMAPLWAAATTHVGKGDPNCSEVCRRGEG